MGKIEEAIDRGGGQACDVPGVIRELNAASYVIVPGLRPIADAPRDGREVLVTDGATWRVAVPKLFGDKWEWFRSERFCPGHTWSITPTHFILLEDLPVVP